jgi:phosphoribosylglycinamide formyltransferase-1
MPVVVLISGSGSNLQAIINAAKQADSAITIRAVISNKADAYGLQRAAEAGIETGVLDHKQYDSREAFDQALMKLIDSYQPGLVVLAGFMRILTEEFVEHYLGRMLNIHPSLLPDYRGLNTHTRALNDGQSHHGATVHFVTPELDGGPLILQAKVNVQRGDTPEILAQRVLQQEHIIYPKVIDWFARGRLRLEGQQVIFDGQPLTVPRQLND